MKRQQEILPIKYYHVVFTVPHELNDLIKNHPRLLYNMLFRAAWHSLKTLLAQPKWCGGEAGMLAVLHTWGQNLSFHPHLHCIVPAGGLSSDQQQWRPTRYDSVLVDVEVLSELFQKTFLRMLREEWEETGIDFRGKAAKYHDLEEWRDLFIRVEMPWVVYCKAPSMGATQTLEYLSRYTHAVAISEYRILELTADKVKLQYKDYADKDEQGVPKKKPLELDYLEFIRRFVQHILPSGFHKIRYFGIWASANRRTKLQQAQRLLGQVVIPLTMALIKVLVKLKLGIDPTVCGVCGSMDLEVEILPARTFNRSPSKVVRTVVKEVNEAGRSPPQRKATSKTQEIAQLVLFA